VLVDMDVWLWRGAGRVAVLMVCVMHVDVLMYHRLMFVLVLVPLRQVQPEADRHESSTGQEGGR
jgi:hypothetical protein